MKKNDNRLSRRNFLGTVGTATAAFTIVPRNVIAGRGYMQPSDTVNIASIGLGAQGTVDVQNLCAPDVPVVTPTNRHPRTGIPYTRKELSEMANQPVQGPPGAGPSGGAMGGQSTAKLANIYALCDTDTEFAGHVFKGYPKAKIYTDWRELLEKEASNIDAVNIATPDHNHAIIAAHFIREKKHVYVQKPMAKTPYECRKLAELAREYNVATQMGNQGHADEGSRQCVEWVQAM